MLTDYSLRCTEGVNAELKIDEEDNLIKHNHNHVRI